MKKWFTTICNIMIANLIFAQFTPPADSNSTVMVNDNGVLQFPTAAQFIDANDIASEEWVGDELKNYPLKTDTIILTNGVITSPLRLDFVTNNRIITDDVICVKVNTFRGGTNDSISKKAVYWWEAEVKVISPDGQLLYRATTVWSDKTQYHSELGINDNNCEIYYYTSGANSKNSNLCANAKIKFVPSSTGKGTSITAFESLQARQYNGVYYSYPVSITTIEFYPDMDGTLPNGAKIRDIFLNKENSIVISRKNSEEFEKDLDNKRIWRAAEIIYYRK